MECDMECYIHHLGVLRVSGGSNVWLKWFWANINLTCISSMDASSTRTASTGRGSVSLYLTRLDRSWEEVNESEGAIVR